MLELDGCLCLSCFALPCFCRRIRVTIIGGPIRTGMLFDHTRLTDPFHGVTFVNNCFGKIAGSCLALLLCLILIQLYFLMYLIQN